MLEKLREFLRTGGGRAAAIGLTIVAVIFAVLSMRSNLGQSEAGARSRERLFICSETGKTFELDIKPGMTFPVKSPYSGKPTGYEAELCFWTASGGTKTDPTAVLLNQAVGKPGPTFCPDCGRIVVQFNPPPVQGVKPPPTKAEYRVER